MNCLACGKPLVPRDNETGGCFRKRANCDRVCASVTATKTRLGRTNAKLTGDQVREIKRALATGEHPREVAPRFGVKQPTICAILYGTSWRHIE